jgi:hypothetical protein
MKKEQTVPRMFDFFTRNRLHVSGYRGSTRRLSRHSEQRQTVPIAPFIQFHDALFSSHYFGSDSPADANGIDWPEPKAR